MWVECKDSSYHFDCIQSYQEQRKCEDVELKSCTAVDVDKPF